MDLDVEGDEDDVRSHEGDAEDDVRSHQGDAEDDVRRHEGDAEDDVRGHEGDAEDDVRKAIMRTTMRRRRSHRAPHIFLLKNLRHLI